MILLWNNQDEVSIEKSFPMTQINMNDRPVSQRKRAGVRKLAKHSLKTDMTPMVDLGFLLITFFVITAELNKPTIMNLYMPKDGKPMPSPESRSVTFLISGSNKLFYYYGTEEDAIKKNHVLPVSYNENSGVGKIIREKQMQLERSGVNRSQLMVLIKPGKESTYKNAVDMLDEMTINGVTRYAIVKPGKGDLFYLDNNR
jgi:biopolymer transport protein ExbD